MYSVKQGLVLGFHGCDETTALNLLNHHTQFKFSTNSFDWLGHGIYFWENSPSRALDYAAFLSQNPERSGAAIKKPAVVGAVLDLGNCLDLLDFENLQLLKYGYSVLQDLNELTGSTIPENKPVGGSGDLLLRDLDCAVLETIHKMRDAQNLKPFDSVRGVFWEGPEIYPSAGFREKDHIQLCIRNMNCIKGIFLPRNEDHRFPSI